MSKSLKLIKSWANRLSVRKVAKKFISHKKTWTIYLSPMLSIRKIKNRRVNCPNRYLLNNWKSQTLTPIKIVISSLIWSLTIKNFCTCGLSAYYLTLINFAANMICIREKLLEISLNVKRNFPNANNICKIIRWS